MATDREFKSCHRFARISPRKARYVMDLVRGLPVEQALNDLRFSLKRATPMITKVIKSALANATQEAGLEGANLYISQALIDVGPRIKRWKPRAMGRAYPRMRRTCHISVVLREAQTTAAGRKTAPAGGEPEAARPAPAEGGEKAGRRRKAKEAKSGAKKEG